MKIAAENVVAEGSVYSLIRPFLFSLSPRQAHAVGMAMLSPMEHIAPLRAIAKALYFPSDPRLRVRVMGLDFPSPIGLAAGFDKNAHRPHALAALGFGHLELGTVTALPQEENPPPNLFRLPTDRALINRLGFPNQGAAAVAARLHGKKFGVPIGLSFGKSRSVPIEPIEGAIDDYRTSFRIAKSVADFIVVNISSPNTKDLRALQGAEIAKRLLTALMDENRIEPKPLLVKIAPDLANDDLDALLDVVAELTITGVVATNTTIKRDGLKTAAHEVEAIGAGGLSGPPMRLRAREVVAKARKRLGPSAVVIGVGGIESASDAMALIHAGADLVQMYTGFIYGGPWAPAKIGRDLAMMVEEAGARTIGEMRGWMAVRG